MRIVIATTQVPFVSGGAEILATDLRAVLQAEGHAAEIVTLPLRWYPPEKILDGMLAAKLLDCEEFSGDRVDLFIGLKFPAYLMGHPTKVLWLVHQHRAAYDLWGTAYDDMQAYPSASVVRAAIHAADNAILHDARDLLAISNNVASRLQKFNGYEARVVYPPPNGADLFYSEPPDPYFFCPGRISNSKRQLLVLQSLVKTRRQVRVVFGGTFENEETRQQIESFVERHQLGDRVTFLGRIDEQTKRALYAKSLAVIYAPFDEDYGYCAPEAMLSAKAVITTTDSGGPLEFVLDDETGIVVAPAPHSIAFAIEKLAADPGLAIRYGRCGRDRYDSLGITWDAVLRLLLR